MPDLTLRQRYFLTKGEVLSWGFPELTVPQVVMEVHEKQPKFSRIIFVSATLSIMEWWLDKLLREISPDDLISLERKQVCRLKNGLRLDFWVGNDLDKFRGVHREVTALVFID